jgi:hypothetical protein
MKYILILFFLAGFISCSSDDKRPNTLSDQQDDGDNPADTNLTPEEKFSSSIISDFLGDPDDDDLTIYLETEIYKLAVNYKGAAVIELTPSTWFVSFEKDSTTRNYVLQKFVDLRSNEYYFRFNETTLTLTDIIIRGRKNPILTE